MSEEIEAKVEVVEKTASPSPDAAALLTEALKNPELLETLKAALASPASAKAEAGDSPLTKLPSPRGTPFPLDVDSVGAKGTGQLTTQAPGNCSLISVRVSPGFKIAKVFAGVHQLDKDFENINKPLKTSDWITVLVENLSDETAVAKGEIFLDGMATAQSGFEAVFASPGVAPGPNRVAAASPPSPYAVPSAPMGIPRNVTPGDNEVAVLLSYGEAQRLLQMIRGGTPIYDYEKPAFERRFKLALGMP